MSHLAHEIKDINLDEYRSNHWLVQSNIEIDLSSEKALEKAIWRTPV